LAVYAKSAKFTGQFDFSLELKILSVKIQYEQTDCELKKINPVSDIDDPACVRIRFPSGDSLRIKRLGNINGANPLSGSRKHDVVVQRGTNWLATHPRKRSLDSVKSGKIAALGAGK
jgi:hypothetical protein